MTWLFYDWEERVWREFNEQYSKTLEQAYFLDRRMDYVRLDDDIYGNFGSMQIAITDETKKRPLIYYNIKRINQMNK